MTTIDKDARAAEFVLGLMDAEAQERAEQELAADPEFADAVRAFEERMSALDDGLPETPAPSHLWQGIADRVDAADQDAAERTEAGAAFSALRRPDRHGALGLRRPLARHFQGFRATALAASILAACALGYVVGQASVAGRDPEVFVLLADEQNMVRAVVEAYGDDSVRVVPLTDFDVPAGKVLEVWTLYDRDVGPVSLGTLDQAREAVLSGPAQPEPRAEQLYEITLEDAPRSSAGRPLGPILVKGLAVAPPQ